MGGSKLMVVVSMALALTFSHVPGQSEAYRKWHWPPKTQVRWLSQRLFPLEGYNSWVEKTEQLTLPQSFSQRQTELDFPATHTAAKFATKHHGSKPKPMVQHWIVTRIKGNTPSSSAYLSWKGPLREEWSRQLRELNSSQGSKPLAFVQVDQSTEIPRASHTQNYGIQSLMLYNSTKTTYKTDSRNIVANVPAF